MISLASNAARMDLAHPLPTPPADRDADLVDLSPHPGGAGEGRIRAHSHNLLFRMATPVLILALWQAVATFHLVPPEVLPSPADIMQALAELIRLGQLQAALPVSLGRAAIGLGIGGMLGLMIGLFAGLWRLGEGLFDAPLQMLRTVPFIALVPLFITWFGIDELACLIQRVEAQRAF
jgi:sulfonate transport system permease protein